MWAEKVPLNIRVKLSSFLHHIVFDQSQTFKYERHLENPGEQQLSHNLLNTDSCLQYASLGSKKR